MTQHLNPHDLSLQLRQEAVDLLTETADDLQLTWKIKKDQLIVELPEIVEEEL